MGLLVIVNEQQGGVRAVCDSESLPDLALRGWASLGPALSPLDTRTAAEVDADVVAADAAEDAAREARLAAQLEANTETPDAAPASDKRATSARK